MEKIRVSELIEFQRKSNDTFKRNFAQKLKTRLPKVKAEDEEDGPGGDYWVSSTTCIYNVVKKEDTSLYEIKIADLLAMIEKAEDGRVKSRHRKNIEIVNNFKDFNIYEIRPIKILKFESIHKSQKVISVNDLPLYLNPNMVFSFEKNGKKEIGSIWLLPKAKGYKKNELGLFCEILHRFLTKHFADNYQISDNFCVAIDTVSTQRVAYKEIISGAVPLSADKTLSEIKSLM